MIFFISCSQLADIPAYKAVIEEMNINKSRVIGWFGEVIRIIRKIPAVTKVDEWTKAEIGVGADMAIGSQAENGNWALFVHLAIISMIIDISVNLLFMLSSQMD